MVLYVPNELTNRLTERNLASVWQTLLCAHAWAFVVKVGIPWMLTEWIRGLIGYGARSVVWMQWSLKTPQHWGLYQPSCHWVVSPANWGMLVEAEWALAWAQLWSGQHWKHTHVHMHYTSQDPSHCLLHIPKRTAVLVARLCGLKLWTSLLLPDSVSISFPYH